MKLEKLESELNLIQKDYQKLIDEHLPPDGNLTNIDKDLKNQLTKMRKKLILLREKISHVKESLSNEPVSEEYLKYLKDLENKFKDD